MLPPFTPVVDALSAFSVSSRPPRLVSYFLFRRDQSTNNCCLCGFLHAARVVEPTSYSYAGCLRVGDGPAERDVATAVSLFGRLGDEGLLEAKVDL